MTSVVAVMNIENIALRAGFEATLIAIPGVVFQPFHYLAYLFMWLLVYEVSACY